MMVIVKCEHCLTELHGYVENELEEVAKKERMLNQHYREKHPHLLNEPHVKIHMNGARLRSRRIDYGTGMI